MGKKPTGSKRVLSSEERSGQRGTLCRRRGSAHAPGGSVPSPPRPCPRPGLLGKVGEVLGDLGDEGQSACGAVVGVLLQQAEQGRGHDGRAQEPQEQGGTDQALADVGAASVAALLSPRGKNFFELSWEDTEMTQGQAVSVRVGVSGV